MTEEELESLRTIFALFDTDGTGSIDASEFAALLEKVGRDPSEGASSWRRVDVAWSLRVAVCRASARRTALSMGCRVAPLRARRCAAAAHGGDPLWLRWRRERMPHHRMCRRACVCACSRQDADGCRSGQVREGVF
jgi:hypothetical protein